MFKYLFFVILIFKISTSEAQEDSISQDYINAVTFFNKDFGYAEYWKLVEFVTDNSGVKKEIEYFFLGGVVENEFLIIKMGLENRRYDLLINLQDTLTRLEKRETFNNSDVYYSPLGYKNFEMHYKSDVSEVYGYRYARKQENYFNSLYSEKFYSNFNVLKAHFKKEESGIEKLEKLRIGTPEHRDNQISEEQRKYIVQANAANEQKDYLTALQLYKKVLDLNLYSYPAAYFNMALILAETNNYYQATYAMKAYLILDPNASDARAAQDKIYEWELFIK